MRKCLPINDVVPGMVIIRVSQQHGPVKIKKSGLVTSLDMVQGLAEMGVSEVEVDLDQTVELDTDEAKPQTQTQTQALLQGQYDKQGHYDNQLADQFNRNLFLPSVQGIPSLWAVYLRQGTVITLTIMIGLALGFGLANPGYFFAEQTPLASKVVLPPVANEAATAKVDPVGTESEMPASNPSQQIQSPVEQTPVIANVQTNEDFQTDQEQGVELTRAQEQEDPATVSPELLRRFSQAIEQVDSRAAEDIDQPTVNVRNDIQRIDQLPVRLMTTLPSMTFSAHMYATRESDRWVRVNGRRKQEGDMIADEIQIVAIEPQRVVLSYQNEIFSMAALTDW